MLDDFGRGLSKSDGPETPVFYGKGWMPHRSRAQYADVQALLPKSREMAAEAGRDPASMPITIRGAKENLDLLKLDRDHGVSRLVVSMDSGKADTILPEPLGDVDPPTWWLRRRPRDFSSRCWPLSAVPIALRPFRARLNSGVDGELCRFRKFAPTRASRLRP